MQKTISAVFRESGELKLRLSTDQEFLQAVQSAAAILQATFNAGGTMYACGNGGSAADSIHFCEELTARYKKERPGLRAMNFLDPGFLTCWANDYEYASVFERGVRTFCTPRDCLVAISTSGNSENVLRAASAAREIGTKVIGLLGATGGRLAALVDCPLLVPSAEVARVQEVHITLVHIFCDLLEEGF